jgi:RHS repeat-associated protein
MANANVSYTYVYDTLNRVVSLANARTNFRTAYEYDAAGNRTKLSTYVQGSSSAFSTTQYVYDAKNRLTSIKDSVVGTFGFNYDAMDRRTSLAYPNGVTTSYAYDNAYRLTAIAAKDALGNVADAWSYQYDATGNRTSKTDMNGAIEVYAYDNVYRLTKAAYGDGTAESFTYDPAGNRLTRTDQSGTTATYSYDLANQLLKAGSDTFTYDANGNMLTKVTSAGTTTLTYNPRNLPTTVAAPDGTETNRYGPMGERMDMLGASIENGEVYPEYDLSGNPFLDTDGGLGVWTYRVYGPGVDEPLAEYRRNNGRTTYLHHDALGSVTAVSNTAGQVAYRSTYKAFGQMSRTSYDLPTTRLGYTSRETSVGGLMQYRSRYYDSACGRFLQQDSQEGSEGAPPSLHRYTYVLNNPIRYVDPTGNVAGLPAEEAFWLAVDVSISISIIFAVAGFMSRATEGKLEVSHVLIAFLAGLASAWRYITFEFGVFKFSPINGVFSLFVVPWIMGARVILSWIASFFGMKLIQFANGPKAQGMGVQIEDAIIATTAYTVAISFVFAAIDGFMVGSHEGGGDDKGVLEKWFKMERGEDARPGPIGSSP